MRILSYLQVLGVESFNEYLALKTGTTQELKVHWRRNVLCVISIGMITAKNCLYLQSLQNTYDANVFLCHRFITETYDSFKVTNCFIFKFLDCDKQVDKLGDKL